MIRAAFQAAEWVDSALCKTPIVRTLRGVVLDIVLGPKEDFEYVSRTTPRHAPTPR